MAKEVQIYVNDHLAGAAEAIALTEFIQEENNGTPLGEFASELLREITQDRDVLLRVAKVLDVEPSSVKKALGWIGEKAARMKLGTAPSAGFGMLEALELLELGIQGKWAMWRSLSAVAESHGGLRDIDFTQLLSRAEHQRDLVEAHRFEAARLSLRMAA